MPNATAPKAPVSDIRTFHVFAAQDGGRHGHDIEGMSFEDAALTFVETFHPPADADGDIDVIVIAADNGRQQCFRVDVGSGEALPCG